jgi:hypothetical protein
MFSIDPVKPCSPRTRKACWLLSAVSRSTRSSPRRCGCGASTPAGLSAGPVSVARIAQALLERALRSVRVVTLNAAVDSVPSGKLSGSYRKLATDTPTSGVRPCRSDDLDQTGASSTTPRLLQKSEPLSASLNPLETPHIAAAALLAANSLRFLPRSDGKPIRCGTNLPTNRTVLAALHH